MSAGAPSISARAILATSAYTLIAGVVVLVLALTAHAELIVVWLGFVGVGGLGGSIKGQLSDVARTVGTTHLQNGASLATIGAKQLELEQYTHKRMHELANGITAIKASLVLQGAMPASDMTTGAPAPPSMPPAVEGAT